MAGKLPKYRIRKGDEVVVIAGDDRGKRGKVLSVDRRRGLVVVEKVNVVRRHLRPSPRNPRGGVLEKEAPIAISNVQLWDPAMEKPTRIGYRFLESGEKVRVRKASQETIG
jgi:large subunit ribosomal protein L24